MILLDRRRRRRREDGTSSKRADNSSCNNTLVWCLATASLGVFLVCTAVMGRRGHPLPQQQRWLNEDGGDDAHHDGHDEDDFQSTFMVCIVLGLLFLTIAFEWLKETIHENVSEQHERVIEKLFGEMTILGFLSMVTFLVNEAGLFRWVSTKIFGHADDHEHLLEAFEIVHMSLFFIMVFFFIQVLVLIRQAMANERQWIALDREHNSMKSITQSSRNRLKHYWAKMRHANSFVSLLPFFRNTENETEVDRIYFRALRNEFLLDRDMHAPFAPSPASQRLHDDFNFGRYLGLCLVRFLSRVVDVSSWTLCFFALASVVAYAYILLVQERMLIIAWTWLGLEWAVFIFHVLFEQHVLKIRKQLIATSATVTISPSSASSPSEGSDGKEFQNMDYQNETPSKSRELPGWCSIDLDDYLARKRPWFNRFFVGGTPNRQETLFWLDRWGPDFYLGMLQANLIFIGLDCALQFMFFYPLVYTNQSQPVFLTYLALSGISMLGSFLNKKSLMAILAVVCSVGSNSQYRVIEKVCREEKTENLVRAFLIVYRLRRLAQGRQWTDDWVVQKSSSSDDVEQPYTEVLDSFEIASVLKIFDGFDNSGDGFISRTEFGELLGMFGGEVAAESIQQLMATLDGSGDGQVDRQEFLQWYSDKSDEDDDILRSAPQQIFHLFDDQHTGALTIAQFKDKLDALRLGFTVDEQLAIVNELDRRGHGTIGAQEFERLFAKFNPRKLRKSEQKFFFEMLSGCNEFCGMQMNPMT